MISTYEIILDQLILNKWLPTQQQTEKIKELIPSYKYPIGMVSGGIFSKAYNDTNYDNILQYAKSLLQLLFSDIYTEDELEWCAYYLTCDSATLLTGDADYLQVLSFVTNLSSEKEEIQFIIEELQFKYLRYLFYKKPTDESVLFLIDKLSAVEEKHNKFNIGVRK